MSAARRRGRLHGARARARAVAALRERGHERGRAAARRAPTSRSRSGCRGSSRGDAIVTTGVARAAATASARGACRRRATRRRRRLRARRREVARAVRVGGRPRSSCSRAPATATTTSTCSSSTRRAGRHADAAADDRRPTRSTRSTLDGVRVPASARIGARRLGLGDVARHDARRHRAARGAGGRRRAVRARHHRAVREGPRAVRQAARRVPGDRALPRRRGDRRSTARETLVYEAAWARAERPLDRPARADGEAVRVQDLPRRHRDGAADLRRRRLHARVRHPAVLPPGQAAPDLVVGRPRPRRAHRGSRCWGRESGGHARRAPAARCRAGAHGSGCHAPQPRRARAHRPRGARTREGAPQAVLLERTVDRRRRPLAREPGRRG